MKQVPVIGRFAPSPSGDLHFGSLIAAVGSFLEAKTRNGRWLLRVEDIDPPREVAGSASRIINDLRRLGMVPDGPVLYQSSRLDVYQSAVDQLLAQGRAYPCVCSRKDMPASGIYPGTCRNGITDNKKPASIRFYLDDSACQFKDRLQGRISESPDRMGGDFILKRSDGLFAYQLAVVIDDDFQGVTHIVRGADLLGSTSRQICLQKALGLKTPVYTHLPVALATDGKKLSKRDQADPVKLENPAHAVEQALHFLGQYPPEGLSLNNLWIWALEHWSRDTIPRLRAILPSKG